MTDQQIELAVRTNLWLAALAAEVGDRAAYELHFGDAVEVITELWGCSPDPTEWEAAAAAAG